jgi:hypothetical protein
MDIKVDNNIEFSCNICNKLYSSYKSLWNHNNKFHNKKIDIVQSKDNHMQSSMQSKDNHMQSSIFYKEKSLLCKNCNKLFTHRNNRWRHEQKCKHKDKNIDEIANLKKQNKQLELTINELKTQVTMILKEKGKIHHKTLQKINNQLNNINNGSIINNTYVKFGDIDYEKILNNKQINNILNKQFRCLEESIKVIHFNNKLQEYNNVFITNMKDDIAYIFDGKRFISVRKNEMLNDLINTHVNEINLSLEKNKDKMNEYYVTKIEKFIDMLNDEETKFTDDTNQRVYNNYKAYKMNSVKLLIYNESDKKKLELLNGIELEEKLYDNNDSKSLII